MSEFSRSQPKETPSEKPISQESVETSLSSPLNSHSSNNTKPTAINRQMLSPQKIITLQKTIGNQAVQRLIKQTLQRHPGHEEQEEQQVQRLMTQAVFKNKTKAKAGKRGGNNPVLLEIDRLLGEYHDTVNPPNAQRKKDILSELTIVKDWLDKKGAKSSRQAALQELWNDIVLENTSDPQANVISMPAAPNLHQTLEPDSLYASIHKTQPPGLEAAIKELQNKLNTGLLPKPNLDSGIFDAATEKAVLDFKVLKNLPKPTVATVDGPVWAALDAAGTSNIGQVNFKSSQQQLSMTAQLNVKYVWEVKDNALNITVKINFDDMVPSKNDINTKVSGLGGKKGSVINNVIAGIDRAWNQFKIVETTTKKARDLVFTVQSVTSDAQDVAKVALNAGNGRSTGTVWYAEDSDLSSKTAPHEFGHIVGLADEYGRGHADYYNLTGLKPLQEKSGLTDAKATDCANKLTAALNLGLDKDSAKTALVEAAKILKKFGIYDSPGTGQPVENKFPTVVAELNRVHNLIGKRAEDLSNGKTAGDTLEEATAPFSYQTKSIMGGMQNATPAHDHGVELRHVRFFTTFVNQLVPGNYDVEKR